MPKPTQDESIYDLRHRHSTRVSNGPIMMIGGWVIGGMGAIGCLANVADPGLKLGVGLLAVLGGCALLLTGRDWKNSPLRWYCPSCGKLIHAKMEWRCGYCDHVSNDSSFLDRCGNSNCRTPAKSMECPHCELLLFLDRDHDGRHPARRSDAAVRPLARAGDLVQTARHDEIAAREHERAKMVLDIELKKLDRQLHPPRVEPVDIRKKRAEWFSQRLDLATLECHTLKECAQRKADLIEEIKMDDSLTPKVRKEILQSINSQFEAMRIQIERGDISI